MNSILRTLSSIFGLLLFVGVAVAQTPTSSTRAALEAYINTNFPDQFTGSITPVQLRQALLNQAASTATLLDRNVLASSTTGGASLNIPQGSAPTLPVNGDIWTTSVGMFAQIAGVTVGPFGAGGGGGGATPCIQDFLSGTGFTPGSTTALTTSCTVGNAPSLSIYFDGVRQSSNTWSLSSQTVTFDAAIPTNAQVVEFQSGQPGSGVQGPATSVSGDLPTFSGTGGNILQDSGVSIASLSVSLPQGRLTAQNQVAVQQAEEVNVNTVYYVAYKGINVNIGGVSFPLSSEISLTLGNYVTVANLYDLFLISVAGTPTLCVGPAWSTAPNFGTPTTGVQSTAGETETYYPYGGIIVNFNATPMSCKYGAGAGTTASVAQFQGTEVGMIFGSGTGTINAQINPPSAVGGSAPTMGLCNTYNKEPVVIRNDDSTASWTNGSSGYSFANGSPNNEVSFAVCPNPQKITATYTASAAWTGSGFEALTIGILWNSSNTAAGFTNAGGAGALLGQWGGSAAGQGGMLYGALSPFPAVGLNRAYALEQAGTPAVTVFGHDFGDLEVRAFY